MRGRGADELVDVVACQLGHVWKPNAVLRRTAYLMLAATVVLWALNFTVTKYVLEHGFQPLAYSTVRYGAATIIFTWFTYGTERSFRVQRRDLALIVLAAGLGIWLNQLSYVYALTYSNASTIALILGATPIFTALIAFAIGLERLHARFWVAAAVSFAGVALIALGKEGGVSGSLKGDLLGIATAATWAAYTVAIAPLMRSYSPYRISALVLAIGWVAIAHHRHPADVEPVVRLQRAGVGLSRLRDSRTARADEHPLVQGRRPGRAVTGDARREPAAVHRGDLRARAAVGDDDVGAGVRRPLDRRRNLPCTTARALT